MSVGTPYKPLTQRFVMGGIALLPSDLLASMPGKSPYGLNIRSYQEGTFQPREGLAAVSSVALGAAVHSLFRLNDTTSFAPAAAMRYAGSGANLFARVPTAGAFTNIDTGYSGDPLSFVAASPVRSPQPWVYIGDRSRQRKVNTANTVYPIGIAQPTAAPAITLGAPGTTVISDLDVAGDWAAVGAASAAPTNVSVVNTTIATIVYDSGATGYASIAPTAFTNIHVGQRLAIAAAETVLVTDVIPAIATTTIAAIIYDAGATGLCTIQPTASLGTGQLEGPLLDEYRRRFDVEYDRMTPRPARAASRVRQIDFPVNALVRINSGGGTDETVRIVSVAIGQDGIQSFRCSTASAHAAGESLTGVACARAFTTGTRAAGNTLVADGIQQVITPTTVEPVVGGIQDTTLPVNLSLVGGRATQPEDELVVSIKVDTLSVISEIRLYLDIDAASTDFLRNYYFFPWRANDIIAAIHATNTGVPVPVQDARQNTVLQNQIDQTVVPAEPDWQALGYSSAEEWARYNYTPPATTSGAATALNATSAQLTLGNNQWITLKCKIGDLIHVGTDQSRTLANVGGVEILVTIEGTTAAVTLQYDAALIQGGYGPDVGDTGAPYIYGYRYRSSTTGARSNLSPSSRGGVVPRRQAVTGTATASADAQADLIDWFRYGGALTRWTYVMTGATLTDTSLDSAIDGQPGPDPCFQPWPTSDLPRSGTCNVAGTAVTRVAGDQFNTSWAPGTAITINGITTTLYAQPTSASLLHLTTNVGSGAAVAWSIREPLLLSQNLPALFGGAVNGVLFTFACGDPTDPGALHWTFGNDPDGTSDAHWLAVTTASEPLQHGCWWDQAPFVFSSDHLYRLLPSFGALNTFTAQRTPCGKGLWSRWAFAAAPEGIYFLAKDGIYVTAGGSVALSITDDDLRALFPHDGTPGVTVNGIVPPNMTATTRLKLTVVDQFLYFDYRDTAGTDRTLIYERTLRRWFHDQFASGVSARLGEGGPQVETQIVGLLNGHVYQCTQTAFADADLGSFAWHHWTAWPDAQAPRTVKQFGDLIVDYDQRGAVTDVSAVVVYDDATTVMAAQTFGAGTSGRRQQTLDLTAGAGVLARNLGLRLSGLSTAADANRPLFYLWEASYLDKADNTQRRATDWDDLGYVGEKFIQGIVIRANTYGATKQVAVQGDGATQLSILVDHDGELEKAYPLASAGWTPFTAQLVRLLGDATAWQLYNWRWVWEPAPELATTWESQFTTHDLPGYLTVRDVLLAHQSTRDLTVQIDYENGDLVSTQTYTVPHSDNTYRRSYVVCEAAKGRAVRYRVTSHEPCRLFKRDCAVRVQGWGSGSGYLQTTPFGGPSRLDGAAI